MNSAAGDPAIVATAPNDPAVLGGELGAARPTDPDCLPRPFIRLRPPDEPPVHIRFTHAEPGVWLVSASKQPYRPPIIRSMHSGELPEGWVRG